MPTKIYSYGSSGPLDSDLAAVEGQLRLAHDYRNALVELEIERRKRVDAALARVAPGLAEVERELPLAEASLEAARKAKRALNARRRKKVRDPETRDLVKEAVQRLRDLRARRKELRARAFESPDGRAAQDEVEAWFSGTAPPGETRRKGGVQKTCRASFVKKGIYWGTYLLVEESLEKARKGAPPKFQRWTGEGRCGVQLQGGLSVPDTLAGADTQLRVEARPRGVWVPGSRRPRKLGDAVLMLRVGSRPDRTAKWVEVPFRLHRPLPDDAQVKRAWLLRRRVGVHWEWRVQFTLTRATWPHLDAVAATGMVGIDVGWRLMEQEGGPRLRVAAWEGSDGEKGELSLPPDWLQCSKKVEDLRSIRDRLFDDARSVLGNWVLSRVEDEWSALPSWLRESIKTLASWKSQGRLAALSLRWRKEVEALRGKPDLVARPGGHVRLASPPWDGPLDALERWRKDDLHLLSWEAHLRDQLQARRLDIYRVFAATMRRRYASAAIEDLDLRDFHVLPEVEDEENRDGRLKAHVRDACLSDLVKCLRESLPVVEVPAPGTTFTCSGCRSEEEWDHVELRHRCSKCGVDWDQDENAARNILRAGADASASAIEEPR